MFAIIKMVYGERRAATQGRPYAKNLMNSVGVRIARPSCNARRGTSRGRCPHRPVVTTNRGQRGDVGIAPYEYHKKMAGDFKSSANFFDCLFF